MFKPARERTDLSYAEIYRRAFPALRRIAENFVRPAVGNFWSPYVHDYVAPCFGVDLQYAHFGRAACDRYAPIFRTCAASKLTDISLLPNGRIYSCPIKAGAEKFEVGQYYPHIRLRKLTSGIDSGAPLCKGSQCEQCAAAPMCGGGCPIAFDDDGGEMEDIPCHSMMNELKAFVRLNRKQILKKIERLA
jgi:radical SAM protein with 4Fe4S-binding SPASM domain